MLIKAPQRAAPLQFSISLLACVLALGLASCMDKAATHDVADDASEASKAPPFVAPQDVFERTGHSIVGISYPPGLERFPALSRLLTEHAAARRSALNAALQSTPAPPVPYELILRFTILADAPRMFAVAADEDMFTGGPTSRAGHAVFLWLPVENRLLSPDEMIPNPAAWSTVHEYILDREREESASLAAANAPADARGLPHAFSPRFNSAGRIAGLRFRARNGDEIEVPGAFLKPLVAPAYATWFEDTAPAAPGRAVIASP